MSTDLRFQWPTTATPGPVDLRFGDALVAPQEVIGELSAALPAGELPLTTSALLITYDQAIPDAIGPGIVARHAATRDDAAGIGARQQTMITAHTPAAVRAQQAALLSVGTAAVQRQMILASRASAQRAQYGLPLGNGRSISHAETLRRQRTATLPVQQAIPLGTGTHSAHQERIRFRHRLRTDQQQATTTTTARATVGHKAALQTATRLYVGQQQMIPLPLGWWQIAYPWPDPPIDPDAPSSPVDLRFCHLYDGGAHLVFGCPGSRAGIIVPVRRTYLVLNAITLVRASDGAPLDATALNLQIDADSWTWGWDATIPGAQLALVEPIVEGEPVELLGTLNGQQFRLLAERLARDRSFAQSRLRISGRGRAAMLASPHSPIVTRNNAADRTAQQLLADALTINGVSIGWAVDWQAADWLVPTGLYAHTGSYIEHAQRLAEAAGAYVQADPLTDTLHILPRYPQMPWEWSAATPDIILPSAPVVREAVEWMDKARYNRVFVSGTEAGGILGQVTRNGTAGDIVAPMVTDPLCTHADAARARGGAILADTGRQARITLDLPILTETGIIRPGALVEYTDAGTARRGLVRSTAVRAQLPTARQTIELETHV
ncbi:MAG: hypothetical protein RBT67_07755 [Thauera sp.]|nr:hypothetical protein [Thauera sp.]